MIESLIEFFNIEQFMPHGYCFLWNPGLLWGLVISDAVIAISYYSIPLALLVFVKRRGKRSLNWIFIMFSAFIFACGTTHLFDIMTIWYPNYWIDVSAKMITALVSAITAVLLWPLVQQASSYVDNQERVTEELTDTNFQLRESLTSLKQQGYDLQRLNKMGGYLDVCNSDEEIGSTISETLKHLWPESSGTIYFFIEHERKFEQVVAWGQKDTIESIEPEDCWSYRLDHSYPEPESASNLVCHAHQCSFKTGRICIPITSAGNILGLLQIVGVDTYKDERAKSIMPILIERTGLAIHNVHLKNNLEFNSTRDSLTGLFNRRYMEEALQLEEKRARRVKGIFSLVIFDLDHFKVLNDTYGHEMGDKALQYFSKLIQSNLREGDIACRMGGEEFLLILPATDTNNARDIARRISATLDENLNKNNVESLPHFTVSAGIAVYPEHGNSSKDVLRNADRALYDAKEAGRNCVKRFKKHS